MRIYNLAYSLLLAAVIPVAASAQVAADSTAAGDSIRSTQRIQEIVVTALGIRQPKQGIGYATQAISGEELSRNHEPNLLNGFSGRIAGAQVISSSGTPGASSYIRLRGSSSITGKGDNAIAGNGDPLFVIDGVPVDNSQLTYRGNAISDLKDVAFSNRAIDINPDDIESATVLKGPAATVLYGSRAAGGAILITTKKGKSGKLRISYNGSLSLDKVNKLPELQNNYSQGYNGQFTTLNRNSWGTSFDSLRVNPAGNIVRLSDSTAGYAQALPYDNAGAFFQPGLTTNNTVALSGGSQAATFYASVGHLSQEGVVPLSSFQRTSVRLSGTTSTKAFVFSGSVLYTNSGGRRFQQGSNESAIMVGLLRTPPSFEDAGAYKNADGTQRSFSAAFDNPYFSIHENPLTDEVNRLNGFVSAAYDPLNWLSLTYRLGADFYSDRRVQHFAPGNRRFPKGQLYEDQHTFHELNSDLLLTLRRSFLKNTGSELLLGYSYNQRRYNNLYAQGDGLTIPGYYNLNNADAITASDYREYVWLSGLFAQLKSDYRQTVFLELSCRRDAASTFGAARNSFYYPSANGVLLFSKFTQKALPVLSYGKLRLAYGQAGKEPNAYHTATNFGSPVIGGGYIATYEFPFLGINGLAQQTTGGSSRLQPEVTSSYEAGVELQFWQNRLSLDATLYRSVSKNQIIPVSISSATGLSAIYGNYGSVENKGIELLLSGKPVSRRNFQWTGSVNFSRNRNTVLTLAEGLDGVSISSNFLNIKTRNVAGAPYGALFGSRWLRNGDGQLIIEDDPTSPGYGFPKMAEKDSIVGDPNPDWLAGFQNEFRYKSIYLTFLVDVRKGGDIWNGTKGVLNDFGVGKETEDRGQTKTFDGVKASNGAVNDISVAIDQKFYQTAGSGFNGPVEQYIEDGSWLRLREISLGWSLPATWLRRAHIASLDLSLYSRNLLLFTPYSGIDPETNLKGADPGQGFDYFNMPNTKSYGVSLKLTL